MEKSLLQYQNEGLKKGDWLWCLHCERVFKWDGEKEDCGYPECDGGPTDIESWVKEGIPRFIHPDYPEEPELGIKYPLY